MSNWLRDHGDIGLVMVLFALTASLYSVVTPLFEMSDELWHYPMVKTLADGNGLPVQDPDNVGPWRQEGSQPPLYYYMGAALTFWIDTDDMSEVRRENPHVDNGIVTPDGNINLIVHNYEREQWPWKGTVLAVHIVRLMSVVMSTATVYVTFLIGRAVFPQRRWLALAAAASVGFTPMFTFISGAVNNDNLAVLLAALGLYLMIRIAQEAEEDRDTLRLAITLGIVLGLSALTKASVLGQFGLAGLTMAYAAFRKKRWQTFFIEGPLIIGIAAAIGGWWYWRNYVLYGDPFGLNVFIEILGERAREASLRQLWTERVGFMQSYWGLFGGVNVPMPYWIYTVLNTAFVLGWVGAVITLVKKARQDGTDLQKWVPTLLSLLWIAAVIVPLATYWARVTWSSQGRLVFSAIMSINLWVVAGLSAWLPEKIGRWTALGFVSFLAVISVVAPLAWIRPVYQPDIETAPLYDDYLAVFSEGDEARLGLVDAKVQPERTTPGEAVRVELEWQMIAGGDVDLSTFIHLEDSADFRAGQRDTYPGLGLLATSDLEAGATWTDSYVVPVSESAYAPEPLDVMVGLYDYEAFRACPTCPSRLVIAGGGDAVRVGGVTLEQGDTTLDVPNETRFNFGDQLALVGYSVEPRSVPAGEEISLTLYWQSLRAMEENYTISVQVLDEAGNRVAQRDSWPQNGDAPTSAWATDAVIEDVIPLAISEDAPAGEYNIQVVVYALDGEGGIDRLQRITAEGRLTDDFLLLTRVRVQ